MAHNDSSTITAGGKERIARVIAHLPDCLFMMSGYRGGRGGEGRGGEGRGGEGRGE